MTNGYADDRAITTADDSPTRPSFLILIFELIRLQTTDDRHTTHIYSTPKE